MTASTKCQACARDIEEEHRGHGRRFCLSCSPPVAAAHGRTCPHDVPIKMECAACTWDADFQRRRYASIGRVVAMNLAGEDAVEEDLLECRRALRREVAAIRRAVIEDEAERARRLKMVKDEIRTEMADVKNDWQFKLLQRGDAVSTQ